MSVPPKITIPDMDRANKRKLFGFAMRGEWNKVLSIYEEDTCAHKAKITRSGDTALHIAVSDGKEDIVEKLVKLITICKNADPIAALDMKNDRGNTALHRAASMGNVKMCECIAAVDSKLVGTRNADGETPFFLAALHGKKEAFFCLHNMICGEDKGYSYCRRNDGETILHSAINGDYFELAYQIIFRYENLVHNVDEEGMTPLHLLAGKPSAFKSGSRLTWWNKIVYHCIFVDQLEEERPKPNAKTSEGGKKFNFLDTDKYPKNYYTCINFFQQLQNMIQQLCSMIKEGTTSEDEENCQTCIKSFGTKQNMIQRETTNKKGDTENPPDEHPETAKEKWNAENVRAQHSEKQSTNVRQGHQLFPSNYGTCFDFFKLVSKAMLVILGFGSRAIIKIQNKKEKHTWSVQIMNELLQRTKMYEYEDDGKEPERSQSDATPIITMEDLQLVADQAGISSSETNPEDPKEKNDKNSKGEGLITMAHNVAERGLKPELELKLSTASGEWLYQPDSSKPWTQLANENMEKKILNLGIVPGEKKSLDRTKRETAILIAAKNGVTEMVEKILELFPVAIHDINSEKKNMVLLAVENRQPHVYQLLLKKNMYKDSVFRIVDYKGNSALHLAAMQGEFRPWLIPGAALQMQWEMKWYEFVKNSMPLHFFVHHNKDGKTPKNVFTDTHKELVKNGGEWLTNTSESCSVVAALIATVAFATAATVPGGINQTNGAPTLEGEPAFNVFAISSLVALCFSVTAVVMFLAILTSRYQERDFGHDLPRKLLVGLTSLFISIASMLISFCAGHFFVLKDKLKYAAFPMYAVTCLPVTFFAIAQFPLYFDLIWASFKKVPQRSYQVVPH